MRGGRPAAILLIATTLAGCAATPPQPATGATSGDTPVTLVGTTAQALQAALGPPVLRRVDGPAQVWLYDSSVCRLNVILYPGPGGTPAVQAAMPLPQSVSQSSCVASVQREKGAGRT